MFRKRIALPGAAVLAIVATTGLGLTACGDMSEQERIEEVVSELQDDLADARVDEVCDASTPQVHKQVGLSGDNLEPTTCAKDLKRLLGLLKPGGGMRDAPSVERVQVNGRRALVTVASSEQRTGVQMRKLDDRWQLANFFGASTHPAPNPGAPATFRTGPSEVPELDGSPVRATTGAGARCPAVKVLVGDDPRRLEEGKGVVGGCSADGDGKGFVTTVRTVFGKFELATCDSRGVVHISRNGRIWIDEFDLDGRGAACGDLYSCSDSGSHKIPWGGRIRATPDGRFRGQVRACMSSCVGRFEGRIDFELVRTATTWRIEFDDAPIGPGAMTFDGSWETPDGEFVKLRQRPSVNASARNP